MAASACTHAPNAAQVNNFHGDDASGSDKPELGYVILRHTDVLDPGNIVFEPVKRGDNLRIKYRHNGKLKILYLQSGPSYTRTPLVVDGALQSTIDFDLCELTNPKSAEFVKKVKIVEQRMIEYLSKTGGDDADVYNQSNLLKSSLRMLTKVSRRRMPAFRISTNSFDTKAVFGKVDTTEDAFVTEEASVQFIIEVYGLKMTRKNGLALGLWRLSQLKVVEDKTVESPSFETLGVDDAFVDDD